MFTQLENPSLYNIPQQPLMTHPPLHIILPNYRKSPPPISDRSSHCQDLLQYLVPNRCFTPLKTPENGLKRQENDRRDYSSSQITPNTNEKNKKIMGILPPPAFARDTPSPGFTAFVTTLFLVTKIATYSYKLLFSWLYSGHFPH